MSDVYISALKSLKTIIEPEQPTREPEAIGRIRGVRRFNIDAVTGLLRGPVVPYVWNDGVNIAECTPITPFYFGCERPARVECTCGFYACFGKVPPGSRFSVLSIIEGFGRTVIGERGFRAEKARIVCLIFPRRSSRLRPAYPDRLDISNSPSFFIENRIRSRIRHHYPSVAIVRSVKEALEFFPLGGVNV
jgi:hypothetical protein